LTINAQTGFIVKLDSQLTKILFSTVLEEAKAQVERLKATPTLSPWIRLEHLCDRRHDVG